MPEACPITLQSVARWYLRLNGFFLIGNYMVHGTKDQTTRTDIDLLGARFPFRREFVEKSQEGDMADDDWVMRYANGDRIVLVFGEVKTSAATFNESWTKNGNDLLKRFLALAGVVPPDKREEVAAELAEHGHASSPGLYVTMLLIHGASSDQTVNEDHWPNVPRIRYRDALGFIHERFVKYKKIKTPIGYWEPVGEKLFELATQYPRQNFIDNVLNQCGL